MQLRIPSFSNTTVVVIGDVMLDRYWYGATGRVSQEAPVPVVDISAIEDRPGGAANVALNLAALGAKVRLIGVVGDDEPAQVLEEKLTAVGIQCAFVKLSGWPTIVKLRVVSKRQQLLRMDFERDIDIDVSAQLEVLAKRHVDGANVVVLEDYDKGTLVVPRVFIQIAKSAGARVVVDPKFKSFGAYEGADLVKPNSLEFRHAVGMWRDYADLVGRAARLAADHDVGAVVVTRGGEGMTLVTRDGEHHHVPAREVDVFDETGAGDTVAAALAAGVGAGMSLHESTMLANLAASLVVAKSGTATVTPPELRRAVAMSAHADRGVLTASELDEAVADAKRRGERIVFTNGCFDILHAGHVSYLEEARTLGDRLIVALNDDASVRKLKGAGRPINALERRQKVLAALACVDWVTGFSEDTPEALLERVRPDVLVKGGDYTLDEVVGADLVRSWNGEVRVLGVVEDVSTTAIVDKLKS